MSIGAVNHATAHGNEKRPNSFLEPCGAQRPQSPVRQREIYRSAGRQLFLSHVRPFLEKTDVVSLPGQKNRHQGSGQSRAHHRH
jgi:hypothetical protein